MTGMTYCANRRREFAYARGYSSATREAYIYGDNVQWHIARTIKQAWKYQQ